MRLRLLAAVCVFVASLGAAGCGGDEGGVGRSLAEVTIALDFTPNPVQTPVFMAVHERADRAHGIRLTILDPGQGPNGIGLGRR